MLCLVFWLDFLYLNSKDDGLCSSLCFVTLLLEENYFLPSRALYLSNNWTVFTVKETENDLVTDDKPVWIAVVSFLLVIVYSSGTLFSHSVEMNEYGGYLACQLSKALFGWIFTLYIIFPCFFISFVKAIINFYITQATK